ncbi:acyl-CoA thioesterase [Ohtaekwangia kribbensis]|jgi:acyl-CoA thioester hydrolase|uniref:Acyl-CoA thioesterase n=1 Tax=Ohtaekwangia kribbensis TaxID=688913 RepID=A0ABW3K3U5_9BACT
MARIQITLPDAFIFTTELTVRASDLNYGAHVGNDSVLTIMQEARIVLYRTLGFKDEISFEGSTGQIIADAAIQYKSEAFLGDRLTVKIAIDEFTRFGFDMYYLLENTETGKEVARGKTGIVCFDYEKRKIAAIPEILLQKLKQ